MTNTPANQQWFQNRAEPINTGSGIAHQIGLGALVDGYAACRTQFLPFCF